MPAYWPGLITYYREYLPVTDRTPIVTINEGNTPLIELKRISAERFGGRLRVFAKFEGLNPTGSFKDRGMTMAISKAAEEGAKAVICASTGNTSAAAAAYAAVAGMRCIVLIPQGKIALGKLAQALMHGATVVSVRGNFDDALRLVREISADHPIKLVNSVNPYRIEGQKTGSFEIIEQLGDAPDFHAIPVGNAGNITAYWKGYKEWQALGKCSRLPVMIGFQAEGAAPIVRGHIVEHPETVATAIRIGNPASWKQAEAARDESHGVIDMISEEEILANQKAMAASDGVFAEPACATPLAGVTKLWNRGYFTEAIERANGRPLTVVCIATGHGLKDPDIAIKQSGKVLEADATKEAILDLAMAGGATMV